MKGIICKAVQPLFLNGIEDYSAIAEVYYSAENDMYSAYIRDAWGDVESAIISARRCEIDAWAIEYGIKCLI